MGNSEKRDVPRGRIEVEEGVAHNLSCSEGPHVNSEGATCDFTSEEELDGNIERMKGSGCKLDNRWGLLLKHDKAGGLMLNLRDLLNTPLINSSILIPLRSDGFH